MNSESPEIEYECLCSEVCDMDIKGCPGHTVKASYGHTSDMLGFAFTQNRTNNVTWEYIDEHRFMAMMEAYNKIRWPGDDAIPEETGK